MSELDEPGPVVIDSGPVTLLATTNTQRDDENEEGDGGGDRSGAGE